MCQHNNNNNNNYNNNRRQHRKPYKTSKFVTAGPLHTQTTKSYRGIHAAHETRLPPRGGFLLARRARRVDARCLRPGRHASHQLRGRPRKGTQLAHRAGVGRRELCGLDVGHGVCMQGAQRVEGGREGGAGAAVGGRQGEQEHGQFGALRHVHTTREDAASERARCCGSKVWCSGQAGKEIIMSREFCSYWPGLCVSLAQQAGAMEWSGRSTKEQTRAGTQAG